MSSKNTKEFKKTINGIEVTAYNDSGSEWVVSCKELGEQRFSQRKFTRKHAMAFMADQAKIAREV